MSEIMAAPVREKNPITGDGYRSTVEGRMARLADYMKEPRVVESVRAVMPQNSEAFVASVLNEIRKSTADSKKDLTVCTPQSLVNTMIDAANLRLSIDGRQHAHIVKRGDTATLQIGYRGYLARLAQELQGFVPVVEVVYQGDEFTLKRDGEKASYVHTPTDPFAFKKDDEIVGAYAYLSWKVGDERVSVITTMGKATIDKIKKSAQTDFIWNAWYSEKAKVAVVRRACKMHFSSLTHDLDAADNEHYDIEAAPKTDTTAQIIDAVEIENQQKA